MRRISLIVPVPTGLKSKSTSTECGSAIASSYSEPWLERCRRSLEGPDGANVVDVVTVVSPKGGSRATATLEEAKPSRTWARAGKEGLVASVMQGLIESDGDYRVLLDPNIGYQPGDLGKILEPLEAGSADLVVARREPSTLAERLIARAARPILGASDPFGGLVAMTSEKARQLAGQFDPVGSRFTIDVLLRLGSRKAEVPIGVDRKSRGPNFNIDDLRHIKRLADDHFGNISRLIQFCVIGASGMIVDLTCYAALQLILAQTPLAGWKTPWFESNADLTVAAAIAIALALTWNFSLNRRLTFSYARNGSILRQYLIYALSNALGIALSFTLRLVLPARLPFFARHRLAAAVVGIVAATGISFSMARWVVFRRGAAGTDLLPPITSTVEERPTHKSAIVEATRKSLV